MSGTLTFKDTIRRLGYTVINDVKVVQYDCVISTENPKEMKIVVSKLTEELYKANRDICRADMAEFEDAAYELQEQYMAITPTE